jgi:hypothetical protein
MQTNFTTVKIVRSTTIRKHKQEQAEKPLKQAYKGRGKAATWTRDNNKRNFEG